tara:strand:+ start:430 stop:654 length:225 start_codon:yes stop_codon:yes gene_type:complete
MNKTFYIVSLFLFLNCCSLNTKSKFWNEETKNINITESNEVFDDKNKDINNSYNIIKKQIIDYGKNKDFPDINN